MTDAPRLSSLAQGSRNWTASGAEVDRPADHPDRRRHRPADRQTSGGLPVTCAADRTETILARIRDGGSPAAARIGRMEAGPGRIRVDA